MLVPEVYPLILVILYTYKMSYKYVLKFREFFLDKNIYIYKINRD